MTELTFDQALGDLRTFDRCVHSNDQSRLLYEVDGRTVNYAEARDVLRERLSAVLNTVTVKDKPPTPRKPGSELEWDWHYSDDGPVSGPWQAVLRNMATFLEVTEGWWLFHRGTKVETGAPFSTPGEAMTLAQSLQDTIDQAFVQSENDD